MPPLPRFDADHAAQHAAASALAGELFDKAKAQITDGMPLATAFSALAMLNGLLLSEAYGANAGKADTAMRQISRASLERTREFHARFARGPGAA